MEAAIAQLDTREVRNKFLYMCGRSTNFSACASKVDRECFYREFAINVVMGWFLAFYKAKHVNTKINMIQVKQDWMSQVTYITVFFKMLKCLLQTQIFKSQKETKQKLTCAFNIKCLNAQLAFS